MPYQINKTLARRNHPVTGDPTEAVNTGRDEYNRIQIEEDDVEAYPDVPTHIGSRRPHADASGVDTFYGMDRAQPANTMGREDTTNPLYPPTDIVAAGLRERVHASGSSMSVNTNRSGGWAAQTYYVDNTQAVLVASEREFRGDTVIVNWSTADVYVSPVELNTTGFGAAVKVVANGGSRVIRTQKQIWLLGTAAAGSAQQVDVQQEYD